MNKNYWKNKRVLITGAEGFVGSHFLVELAGKAKLVYGIAHRQEKKKETVGREIICLDILDRQKLELLCRQKKINLIVHCAAVDGNKLFKKENARKIIDENVRMVLNILNVAAAQKIEELVIFSSVEVYADEAKSPIKEEDDYNKYFPAFTDAYVGAKLSVEVLAKLYAKQFDLKIILPRPTNIYGPGDKMDPKLSRVVTRMIQKISKGEEVEIWGDGSQTLDLIYISDLVKSIMKVMEISYCNAINIASSQAISLINLARLIAELTGKKLKLRYLKTKSTEVKKRSLNIKKLTSIIDFKFLSLEEGLQKTIDAYRQL